MRSPLPKTLQPLADRIDEVEDDRANQNGWWVYLKLGWQDRYNPTCHQIHEDTLKECASIVRDAIPCNCADCTMDGLHAH